MTNERFEQILQQALAPEIPNEQINRNLKRELEENKMQKKFNFKKVVVMTAACCLLLGTISVASSGEVKSSISGMVHGQYTNFEKLQKAEEKAGFKVKALEEFANGYAFSEMCVQDTKLIGEADNVMETYKEISFTYEKEGKNNLYLYTMQEQYAQENSDRYPNQSTVIDDVEVGFYVDTYKWVPVGYELTLEDEENLKRSDYFISDGADVISESKVSHAVWYQSGIRYSLMMYEEVPAGELFTIAGELIKNNG